MPENTEVVGLEPQIRRRNKLTGHTTAVSNLIICGYTQLSDAAKMTYIALESYDWPDENGLSKGKAWPSIATLAADRGKSYDTIGRHLKELEGAGLISIDSGKQQGRANVYWLEEPAPSELEAYRQRCQRRSHAESSNNLYSHSSPSIRQQTASRPLDRISSAAYSNNNNNNNNKEELYRNQEAAPTCGVDGPYNMAKVAAPANVGKSGLPVNLDSEGSKPSLPANDRGSKPSLPTSDRGSKPSLPGQLVNAVYLPQSCPTRWGSNAAGGAVLLPDKGIQTNQIKANQEKDCLNRATRASSYYESDNIISKNITDKTGTGNRTNGSNSSNSSSFNSSSSYISQVMHDFSLALHDTEHSRLNQNQANKLFRQYAASAGLSEKRFVELMYEAKKRTQWAALAHSSPTPEAPNRAAYFFTTLRNLLG